MLLNGKRKTPLLNPLDCLEYPHTEVRKLISDEITQYMGER